MYFPTEETFSMNYSDIQENIVRYFPGLFSGARTTIDLDYDSDDWYEEDSHIGIEQENPQNHDVSDFHANELRNIFAIHWHETGQDNLFDDEIVYQSGEEDEEEEEWGYITNELHNLFADNWTTDSESKEYEPRHLFQVISRESDHGRDANEYCCICMENKCDKYFGKYNCNHKVCMICTDTLVSRATITEDHIRCPLCRTVVDTVAIVPNI
jgi:hypothetical protein